MTDFALAPTDGEAGRCQPRATGQAPRSSMSPTLVFEAGSGRLLMTLGSPAAGDHPPHRKTLLGTLQWAWTRSAQSTCPTSAASTAHGAGGRALPGATVQALRERGHEVSRPN